MFPILPIPDSLLSDRDREEERPDVQVVPQEVHRHDGHLQGDTALKRRHDIWHNDNQHNNKICGTPK